MKSSKQRGITLIICLVILTIISTLAIYGARTTQNELRLSSNQQERSEALQRADNALRTAEELLRVQPDFLTVMGLVTADNNGIVTQQADSWWEQTAWNANSTQPAGLAGSRYTIEYLFSRKLRAGKGSTIGSTPGSHTFRITGQGTGSGGSIVVVQSIFNVVLN